MPILNDFECGYAFEKILTTTRREKDSFQCEILEFTSQTYYVLFAENKDAFKHAETLKNQYDALPSGKILHKHSEEAYGICRMMINNCCKQTYPY